MMPHLFGGLVLLVAAWLPTPVGFDECGVFGGQVRFVAYSTREGSLCMWCYRRRMLQSGMLPRRIK